MEVVPFFFLFSGSRTRFRLNFPVCYTYFPLPQPLVRKISHEKDSLPLLMVRFHMLCMYDSVCFVRTIPYALYVPSIASMPKPYITTLHIRDI